MKLLIPCLLAAALTCAQNSAQLEIRGSVVEGALGIGGVTVTLYEFGHTPAEATTRSVFAVTFTDAMGKFTFHPARAGDYYLEVQKDGYFAESFDGPTVDPVDSTGDPVSIDQEHPLRERKFSLMRLGEIHGRVVDEDGNPLAKLNVVIASSSLRAVARTITDEDGYFAATRLRPGDYQVRIVAQHGLEILPQYSESDLNIVDQDWETSLWPATPLPVSGGASLSVGTVTARKVKYYRAHLSVVTGDCAEGEKWRFSTTPELGGFGPSVPCGKEFMVRNLAPGSYSFSLMPSGQAGSRGLRAITPVEVKDRNLEVTMTMSAGTEISGRMMTVEGTPLPPARINIATRPVGGLSGSEIATLDPAGKFLIRGVTADREQVIVMGLASKFYVKEIRYNGLIAADGIFTPIPGFQGLLDIVIDDKAASISGSVAGVDRPGARIRVLAVKWPPRVEAASLGTLFDANASAWIDDQGHFKIDGLAPGEYRVLALTDELQIRLIPDALAQLLNRAEKVTLERGSSQSISLKIVEP